MNKINSKTLFSFKYFNSLLPISLLFKKDAYLLKYVKDFKPTSIFNSSLRFFRLDFISRKINDNSNLNDSIKKNK